jgi:hypothetical protein
VAAGLSGLEPILEPLCNMGRHAAFRNSMTIPNFVSRCVQSRSHMRGASGQATIRAAIPESADDGSKKLHKLR